MRVQNKQGEGGERVEVISRQAPQFNDLSAKTAAGMSSQPVARQEVDAYTAAPVIGDATERNLERVVDVVPPRRFRVTNKDGKNVHDASTGARVNMHEGKELLSSHYNINDLRKQGLRLQEIDSEGNDVVAPAPVTAAAPAS